MDIVNPDALLDAAEKYWPIILACFGLLRWLLSTFEKRFQAHLNERDHRMEALISSRHHETQDKLDVIARDVSRINGTVRENTIAINRHSERIARIEGPRSEE